MRTENPKLAAERGLPELDLAGWRCGRCYVLGRASEGTWHRTQRHPVEVEFGEPRARPRSFDFPSHQSAPVQRLVSTVWPSVRTGREWRKGRGSASLPLAGRTREVDRRFRVEHPVVVLRTPDMAGVAPRSGWTASTPSSAADMFWRPGKIANDCARDRHRRTCRPTQASTRTRWPLLGNPCSRCCR